LEFLNDLAAELKYIIKQKNFNQNPMSRTKITEKSTKALIEKKRNAKSTVMKSKF
jgi:hypothetical protein